MDERLREMLKVLNAGCPRTREVFLMRRVQERSTAEIASCLGMGVAEVERHIAEAVTALAIARQQRGAREKDPR
jgi:DNA-directed RNA polymerase specialized sigma24 family protein